MKAALEVSRRGWRRLSRRGKKALVIYMTGLVTTAGLDGTALVLVANLLNERRETAGDLSTGYIALIGGLVIGLFLLRSALAVAFSWNVTTSLATEEVTIGSENFEAFSNQPWETAQKLNVSDLYTIVDRGPSSLTSGTMFYVATLVAEVAGAVVIFGFLAVLQPVTAISAGVFFGLVAVLQHKMVSVSAERAGQEILRTGNSVFNILSDAFGLKKVLSVSPSDSLSGALSSQREEYALAQAKRMFFTSLSSALLHGSLVVGVVVVGLATYAIRGQDLVVPALTVFAAAGLRLLPIVNRIQYMALVIVGSVALSEAALGYGDDATSRSDATPTKGTPIGLHKDVVLTLDQVSYRYPDSDSDALVGASLEFKRGLQYAIVGPSGSGKTTLVELCLGLREPTQGSVRIEVADLVCGYVPQDTHMAGVPVFNNVALEWDDAEVDVDRAEAALATAELTLAFEARNLTESVQGMSGGQLQRLGLARALYREPTFLVLDEATSALDATTESSIVDELAMLRGKITVVLVAHRLSTVRNADLVIYVSDGRIVYSGTFVDVYNSVPAFAHQVDLGRFDIE